MFIAYVCAISIVAIVVWYAYYWKWASRIKGIKGPTPIPILGNALEFRGRRTILEDVSRLFLKYGSVVQLMIGTMPLVVVADSEVCKSILRSTEVLEKNQIYPFLARWLKSGLLISNSAQWKTRRMILAPIFRIKILEQFVPIHDRISDILVDKIRKHEHLEAIDIEPLIALSAFDAVYENALGARLDAQLNEESEYILSKNTMGKIVVDRFMRPWEQSKWTYWLTKNYRLEEQCLKVLHSHTKSVIEKRRQEMERKSIMDERGDQIQVSFLDLLLEVTDDGKQLTDEHIQEEVDTFMFAGTDTTASGICFALYLIANHPHAQTKIVAEQEEIFGKSLRANTFADLSQMRYLEMVIKETLRLYPPVPCFGRRHTKDIELANGINIPAGTNIVFNVYRMQHDPKYFSNPERFDPDRFLSESSLSEQPYSFIPFSAGPRNCIGQKFAMLEMKSTISKIMRHFELFSTVPKHQLEVTFETILKPANGIIIQIRDRK